VVLKIIRKLEKKDDFKFLSCLHKGVFLSNLLDKFGLSNLLDKFGFPKDRLDKEDNEALTVFKGSFCSWNWSRSAKRFIEKYHGGRHQKVTS